jgi:putative mRNA 3-end processing factor
LFLQLTPYGLYCAQADVYIDPHRGVGRAIITHAHSDHARGGSKLYLCHTLTKPLLKARLGAKVVVETKEYGETFFINGVKISLHPAGHIVGSAQVRFEYQGEVWVVSGDYKLNNDYLSQAFETVKCTHFISESTFGLPIYDFENDTAIFNKIDSWIAQNESDGFNSTFIGYSLGKAQRLAAHFGRTHTNRVIMHQSTAHMHNTLFAHGVMDYKFLKSKVQRGGHKIILVPPAIGDPNWAGQYGPYRKAMCSGWMAVKSRRSQYRQMSGFAMSDHADWKELNEAVLATGAENIYFTHGYSQIMAKWCTEQYKLNALVMEDALL